MPARVESSARTTKPAAPLSRKEAIRTVLAAFDKAERAKKLKKADLELVTADLYKGKGGVRGVAVHLDREADGKLLGGGWLPTDRIIVDEVKGQVYVPNFSGLRGPLPLPAGVTVAALMNEGPLPKPRGAYQKAVGALAEQVVAKLPTALREERAQFDFKGGRFVSPSGEKMEHHYVDDHTGRIPGGAVMVGKKEFWVEMIPGVSGECIGPFPLPKGFDAKSLARDEPRPARPRGGDRYDTRGRGAGGVDSRFGFPDSLGNRGAGGGGSGTGWGSRGSNLYGGGGGGS